MPYKQAPSPELAAYIAALPTHERHALVRILNTPYPIGYGRKRRLDYANARADLMQDTQYTEWLVETYIRKVTR